MATILNGSEAGVHPSAMLTCADGMVLVSEIDDGRRRLEVIPRPGFPVPRRRWDTAYPIELIRQIHECKGVYTCDEIMREEDPDYVERYLRHEVLGYVDAARFAGKRVLDFGCGSGASTMVLSRLLPGCEIVGIELEEKLLRIARLRAAHFRRDGVRFLCSPAGDAFPDGAGQFDHVIFSAVFEHLLPQERRRLLSLVWDHIRPGGLLFLNQTPHRYAPVETHTTGLPLINYLPDELAWRMATRLSRRVRRDDEWETLLRAGIRGGTAGEVMDILGDFGEPVMLAPRREVGDQIDLWYGKLSRRHAWLKFGIWAGLKTLKHVGRVELTPELALAIRKDH
jgi:2-polyprenyl-3-methyl-5-hydroxy-6-metoxy-1,4-benzoquinol methylase